MTDKDKIVGSKSGGNEIKILSTFSVFKKSTKAGYLISSAKKGDQATQRGGKGAKGSKYLTPVAKKVFNFLRHAFIQALILQHFELERHIQIETNASGYTIDEVLSQLILNDFG